MVLSYRLIGPSYRSLIQGSDSSRRLLARVVWNNRFRNVGKKLPFCRSVNLFWDFRQRRMVLSYRRIGPSYRSLIQGSDSSRRLLAREVWNNRFRNVGKKLPFCAA